MRVVCKVSPKLCFREIVGAHDIGFLQPLTVILPLYRAQHMLRHYFVTSLLHQGVDEQTVAELAGHGDTGFLERTYCHPQMERKQTAARLMLSDLLPNASA